MNEVAWANIIFGGGETVVQTEAEQVGFADARISEVLRRIANEKGNYIHFSLTTLSITVWTHQMVQQFANIVHFQNNGRHGKVKFGSLMGALKLVRTSSKLAHFDALFLHNVCFF